MLVKLKQKTIKDWSKFNLVLICDLIHSSGWLAFVLYFVKSPKLETKGLFNVNKGFLCGNHPIDFQERIFTDS